MNKGRAPTLTTDGRGRHVVIVAASWHDTIMDGLIAGAERTLAAAGASHELLRVPGSFELPLGAQRAAATADAVVALGTVIRGGTPHFEYVCQAATQGLMDVSLRSDVPVGFGLLPCHARTQARYRAAPPDSSEDKGAEAAEAVLALLAALPTP